MIPRARSVALALSGLVLACGPGGDHTAADADALPLLEATETLRLGSVDDPETGFSRIADVAVDRDGLLYVLDGQAVEVRVFDGAARVRTIGRAGDGPGEFRSPRSIGLLGDTLWVIDRVGRRITLFTRAGELLTSWLLEPPSLDPMPGVGMSILGSRIRPDRRIVSSTMTAVMMSSDGLMPTGSFEVPTLLLDTAGTPVDTLFVITRTLESPSIQVDDRRVFLPDVPSSEPWRRPTNDGLFTVEMPVIEDPGEASFVVTRVRGARDTLFRTELHYRPVPFSDQAIDALLEPWAAVYGREARLDAEVLEARARSALEFPRFLPPLDVAHLGEDDMIWLRRQDDGSPSFVWVLIDSAGHAAGRVALPRNVLPRWSRGQVVWAVLEDELDVPWLVRYSLVPATRASGP